METITGGVFVNVGFDDELESKLRNYISQNSEGGRIPTQDILKLFYEKEPEPHIERIASKRLKKGFDGMLSLDDIVASMLPNKSKRKVKIQNEVSNEDAIKLIKSIFLDATFSRLPIYEKILKKNLKFVQKQILSEASEIKMLDSISSVLDDYMGIMSEKRHGKEMVALGVLTDLLLQDKSRKSYYQIQKVKNLILDDLEKEKVGKIHQYFFKPANAPEIIRNLISSGYSIDHFIEKLKRKHAKRTVDETLLSGYVKSHLVEIENNNYVPISGLLKLFADHKVTNLSSQIVGINRVVQKDAKDLLKSVRRIKSNRYFVSEENIDDLLNFVFRRIPKRFGYIHENLKQYQRTKSDTDNRDVMHKLVQIEKIIKKRSNIDQTPRQVKKSRTYKYQPVQHKLKQGELYKKETIEYMRTRLPELSSFLAEKTIVRKQHRTVGIKHVYLKSSIDDLLKNLPSEIEEQLNRTNEYEVSLSCLVKNIEYSRSRVQEMMNSGEIPSEYYKKVGRGFAFKSSIFSLFDDVLLHSPENIPEYKFRTYIIDGKQCMDISSAADFLGVSLGQAGMLYEAEYIKPVADNERIGFKLDELKNLKRKLKLGVYI